MLIPLKDLRAIEELGRAVGLAGIRVEKLGNLPDQKAAQFAREATRHLEGAFAALKMTYKSAVAANKVKRDGEAEGKKDDSKEGPQWSGTKDQAPKP